jgi:hypothetical protein
MIPAIDAKALTPDEVASTAACFDPTAIMPELKQIQAARLSPGETLAAQTGVILESYLHALGVPGFKRREKAYREALESIAQNPARAAEIASTALLEVA